ncbi:FecR family protein [Algoriphagus litoralis]|uniref:FecR family protein n=1 Tax=Algoriphagus litoralis TaxID=2202829 RepID=UPI000DB98CAF|nr:FecR domain-containing protein [Algoriphagus litoralis]
MDHKKIIEDFYSGKLSPEQAREFLEWIESQEAEEYLSAEFIQLWSEKVKTQLEVWDNRPLWEKINAEKAGYSQPFLHRESIPTTKRQLPAWLKYAASILVFTIAFFTWKSVQERTISPELAKTEEVEKWITRSNPAGQKTKILLSDGSTIFLNSASTVTYPENFQTNRKVTLEGEAFFEVAKDASFPFSVESKGITTTALGTSFNISTFNKQDKVAVTLITGKVKVNQLGSKQVLELNPGEESVLAIDEETIQKYKINAEERILWISGVLKFNNTSFDDMKTSLERWYGVSISVSGTPQADLATGTFDNNESLRNVLHVLSGSMGFSYELNEKKVEIHFN